MTDYTHLPSQVYTFLDVTDTAIIGQNLSLITFKRNAEELLRQSFYSVSYMDILGDK